MSVLGASNLDYLTVAELRQLVADLMEEGVALRAENDKLRSEVEYTERDLHDRYLMGYMEGHDSFRDSIELLEGRHERVLSSLREILAEADRL